MGLVRGPFNKFKISEKKKTQGEAEGHVLHFSCFGDIIFFMFYFQCLNEVVSF